MRDPGAREAIRQLFVRADEGERRVMRAALEAAGQRAAALYCDKLRRQHVAVDLLRERRARIDIEAVLRDRFGVSRSTAWRDCIDAEEAISSMRPQ
jgi:hypothetical protein